MFTLSVVQVVTRSRAETRKKYPTESKLYHTAWTHIYIPAFREVDLEASAERGTNRIRGLVNL